MAEHATPSSANPWPKRLGLALLAIILILIAVAVSVLIWIQSSAGRNFVEARLESTEIVGQTVELDGLGGSVLGELTAEQLTISGRDGVWLVARDVSFDWTPRSLLSKTLHVNNVRIGDLDVLQQPILVPSESDSEPLITTFDIQRFSLPDVALSEPVLGQAINVSASGTLAHGQNGGEASLSARSDAGDTVDTDLTWSPLLVLSGEADIEGPAGGLIAGLLRLDPAQSFTADVTTENEQTMVLAQIDGAAFADLTISRGQSSVAVAGIVNPDPLPILESVAPLLGGEARLDAVLPLDEGAKASLDLQAPRVTLSASGARRGDLIELDQFDLTADDLLQSFDLDRVRIGRITASGRAVIGETYSFDGQVVGEALAYNDYRVDRLAGPASLSFDDGVVTFDTAMTGTSSDVSLSRASGAKLDAKGTLDIDRRAISLSQADINLPGLAVRGTGSIGYGDQSTFAFNGRYSVDTSVFRDGPNAQLTGRANVTQTAQGPVAELTGQARSLGNVPDAVTALVPNGFDYTARVRFEDGRVVVPKFTAENDAVKATGSGRWQDGILSSKIDYMADRYEFGAIDAETIQGQAVLSGPPSTLGFETDLTAETLKTGALVTTDAEITANGTYSDGVATLTGTLTGDSEQGRIDASGDIVASGSNWSVTNIQGDLGTLTTAGTLSGIGGDLAAIRGDLVVSGTSDLVPAEAIEAKIRLQDASVDVDATLTGVTIAQLQDATVRIIAKGPRQSVTYTVTVDGMTSIADLQRPLKLTADGVANLLSDALATEAQFDLSVGSLALTGAAAADRGDAGWHANLDANGLGGAIKVDLEPFDGGAVSFDVDSLSVPQLARLLARPATEGSVSGQGRFFAVADNIEGTAQISLEDLRSPISDADAISVLGSVSLSNEQLSMTMGATEGGLSGQASIDGAVDTYPRAPFMTFPPANPLQGKADLNGEIGPIVELFLPPQTDVAGRIDTTLSFTIPNTPTGLQGRVALTDGQFEQGALGLELTDIAMVAELSGETISVPTLSARGVGGGTLSGSGRMGLGEGTGTVDIRTEKLQVVSRREGQAEVSGELNISRTAELLRLGGELRVTDADLNIARLPEPGLPTLEVDFGEVDEEDEPRSFASTATELDIRIISDGRINVRGRGLNAAMNLDATVTGPFDAPVATGQMSIERGRFDFLSKRFEFRESSVTLLENTRQSRLNLEAVRETSELTAVVAITGTLERPEIKLTSEPNLPEDEVLSRILFGRSPTQLSAIETARLAAAISQMSGGSGFDLFGSLENAIGLDTLEVGQNTTGQTQLTTGKYLSDDVYLEVRTAAEGTPGIAVEWAVRDNVSLEAETLPNEGQRLSVQWKKDFD